MHIPIIFCMNYEYYLLILQSSFVDFTKKQIFYKTIKYLKKIAKNYFVLKVNVVFSHTQKERTQCSSYELYCSLVAKTHLKYDTNGDSQSTWYKLNSALKPYGGNEDLPVTNYQQMNLISLIIIQENLPIYSSILELGIHQIILNYCYMPFVLPDARASSNSIATL